MISGFPKVSVCIPVYNGEDYIADAIESILSQTFESLELIVCDNCSTDNTAKVVGSFKDPRVIYIRNSQNLGLVGNANHCLDQAKGEYISILHHDDMMMPDNLERKVQVLNENPNVGFVHSDIMLINPQKEVIASNIWEEDTRRDYIKNGFEVFQRYVLKMPLAASIFIGAVLARRSCYQHVGTFNPKFLHCNDSEMWLRMMLFYDVACIGIPLVKYRVHPFSTSTAWGDYTSVPYLQEHYEAASLVFKSYEDRIPSGAEIQKKMRRAFGARALELSVQSISKGNRATGKVFLKSAIEMHPFVFANIHFWKAAALLMAGDRAYGVYRSCKKNLFSR